jgi:sporulation protein YlmC with PRC-barrel domain
VSWGTENEYQGKSIQGFEAYSSDDERIGTIDQVIVDIKSEKRYLLVKTGPFGGALQTGELYIPSAAVGMVGENRVIIEASREQIESYGWTEPPHGSARG